MRSRLCALFSLPGALVIGQDIPPFGVQGVWANDASLEESLDLLQAAGVRVARTDLIWWNLAEREPGVFNFASPDYPGHQNWNTDRLVEMMHARDIEPYAILCYGNALYDNEEGPHTPEARAAFARFCGEAAARYRDSITIWEIWNEPNLDEYWSGGTDRDKYAPLAIEAAQAIREANPEAIIVGPALSWLNIHEGMLERWYEWLEVCGQRGLYDHGDAISIHPSRVGVMPESINAELRHIREIIVGHTDRDIAIWTGEWGYNTIWTEVDEIEQAKYLPRQFLNNMSQGVEMSIWFSFKPMEGWGMVEEGPDGYVPRPAYRSFQVIADVLQPPVRHLPINPLHLWVRGLDPTYEGGYDPSGLPTVDPPADVRVETFQSGDRFVAALWLERTAETGSEGVPVVLGFNVGPIGTYRVIDGLTGETVMEPPSPEIDVDSPITRSRVGQDQENNLALREPVMLHDHPVYLVVSRPATDEPRGLWGNPWEELESWDRGGGPVSSRGDRDRDTPPTEW
jgi:hypothetical protein